MGTFTMPSLGADMEAGTLVEWFKQPGDEVHHGDIIAVVETEKGAIEVEVFEDGRIDRILVEPGTKVPVGTPLAEIAGAGQEPAAAAVPSRAPEPEPEIPKPPPPPPGPPPIKAPPPTTALRATPAARRLAAERGIDLEEITGTGPADEIRRADVEAAGPAATRPAGPDLGPMRRAIAAAMERSKREIPHYYLTHSVDVSAAQSWLDRYNSDRPPAERLLFGALLFKATALAVREYPEFNGFYEKGRHAASEAIHVGLAIAIRGGGLAAPAIHDTDKLPLGALMAKMHDLVGRVRKGGFRSSEISDPTVTVSALGDRGVEALLPIIYPPQVAIIGFGTPLPRPWAVGDLGGNALAVRPVLSISLAADHRVSDGHRGALLLRRIEDLLQHPDSL